MKFQIGQHVIILDTEFKPAGDAIIRNYEENIKKYEVAFTYPDKLQAVNITIPEERILLPSFQKG